MSAVNEKAELEKRIYEVQLAGLSLKLKTSHDAETVNNLVSFVNQKVNEALKLTKSGSIQNAALLASLNIAEELIILKQKALSELDRIEAKAQRVLTDLESSRQSGNADTREQPSKVSPAMDN
ncbi:MAG: cell division protein ZapA [Bdellovibrionia bacterium]